MNLIRDLWAKDLNRCFTKSDVQIANTHKKQCLFIK